MTSRGKNHSPLCECGFGNRVAQSVTRDIRWSAWTKRSFRRFQSGPNATCPECRKGVFYIAFRNGGGTYFDTFGPPWTKHACTDHSAAYSPYTASGKPKLRVLPTSFETQGWVPFQIRNEERLVRGTLIHGISLINPTVFHLGCARELSIDRSMPVFFRPLNDLRVSISYFCADSLQTLFVEMHQDCLTDMDIILKCCSGD